MALFSTFYLTGYIFKNLFFINMAQRKFCLLCRRLQWIAVGGLIACVFIVVCNNHWQINENIKQHAHSHKSTSGYFLVKKTMEERRQLLQQECLSYNPSEPVVSDTRHGIMYSSSLKMAMCYVPKAGCTFWKRIFLLAEQKLASKNFFDIQHKYIHSQASQITTLKLDRLNNLFGPLETAKRVIFTREPFSRLFSAYVDKFYLANFWNYGGSIIDAYRKFPKSEDIKCGSNVTLTEFLKHVIASNYRPVYGGPEEHWLTITKLCQPCLYGYDIIGHQETFNQDRDYIMTTLKGGNRLGLPKTISLRDTFWHLIYQLVDMNWNTIYYGKIPCITNKNYLRRIWTALQYQGLIQYNTPYPEKFIDGALFGNLNRTTTAKIIYDSIKVNEITEYDWLARKNYAMSLAYKDVPLELKEKIKETFKHDQLLFGYDSRPDYVFS